MPTPSASDVETSIRALLREHPLVDGHNDLAWQYRKRGGGQLDAIPFRTGASALDPPVHTDLPRLREGAVGAQFWSVYLSVTLAGPAAPRELLHQIDIVQRLIATHPDALELARTATDVLRIHRAGRIASLLGIEGGHSIDGSLAVLRQAFALGVRYMTLTHWQSVGWADSATDAPQAHGLTDFGREVVVEMNRLGMIVDLSHVSPATMNAALDVTRSPILFTHSSARALCDHPRNVPDDVLRRLKDNGGVVMATFVPAFVNANVFEFETDRQAETARLTARYPGEPEAVSAGLAKFDLARPRPRATIGDVADHLNHLRAVAGADHIGIGGDFDGTEELPEGLEDVSCYPRLLGELKHRGWSDADLVKLASTNALRVLAENERLARGEPAR